MSDYKYYLKSKIIEAIDRQKNMVGKKTLFVPLGIDLSTEYPENKFSSLGTDASFRELIEYTESAIRNDIVKNYSNNKSWMWISYEEYSQCRDIIDSFFEVRFLKNNLYYNFYPLSRNLEIAELAYEKDGEEVDDQLQQKLDLFYRFYGSVLRTDEGRYFVSYQVEPSADQLIKIFPPRLHTEIFEKVNDSAKHVELESEPDLLDLTTDIVEGKASPHVQLLTDNQELHSMPNNLLERIEILLDIIPKGNLLGVAIVTPEQKPIQHTTDIIESYQSIGDIQIFETWRFIKIYIRTGK